MNKNDLFAQLGSIVRVKQFQEKKNQFVLHYQNG